MGDIAGNSGTQTLLRMDRCGRLLFQRALGWLGKVLYGEAEVPAYS